MHPRPKILIVDDEPFNVDYLEQELEDLNYATVAARDGREALAQVAAESPDLILLDIMMPVMDGFAVLERLKADKATRDIPVVVISAMNDLASVARGIELGAEDYLPKPFDPVLLKARLTNGLEKKRLRDAEQLYLQGLERELVIGREIQAEFLPRELPQPPGWEIAVHFQAAREVAGDFYDAFTLDDSQRIGLIVGDVCGKGVGAALYMTLFRTLLRAFASPDYFAGAAHPGNDADRLLQSVMLTNQYVTQLHGDTSMYATVFFGLIDPANGLLTYMNCGHPPPLTLNASGVKTRLTHTGPPIGAMADPSYSVKQMPIDPAETLLIVTDGTADAVDIDDQFFGEKRLMALLSETRVTTAASLLDAISSTLRNHIGPATQFDDITLLAARRGESR